MHELRVHHILPMLLIAALVSLVLSMAGTAVAIYHGALPPFRFDLPLAPASKLVVINKRPCLQNEPSPLCYYRARSSTRQTFTIIYRSSTSRSMLLSLALPPRPLHIARFSAQVP